MTFIYNLTQAQFVGFFWFAFKTAMLGLVIDGFVDLYKLIYIVYKGVIGWVK